MKNIILAYSGGLDSTVILHWLASKGYEVTTYTAQLGGHPPETEEHARYNGANNAIIEDLRHSYLEVAAQARRMDSSYGNYLLHVALGKIVISNRMIEIANERGIKLVTHGAHCFENDYYRFANYFSHVHNAKVHDSINFPVWDIPEFKESFPDRKSLRVYADANNLKFYTLDGTILTSEPTILGVNYENCRLSNFEKKPEDIPDYQIDQQVNPVEIILHFNEGNPVKLETEETTVYGLNKIITELASLGLKRGIGIVDVVEPNIDGSKARCVYIQPATAIWNDAHLDLGNLVLDKDEIFRRNEIAQESSRLIYNGEWFLKEMNQLIEESNSLNMKYNGWVKIELYPGFSRITGRKMVC